MSSCVLLVVPEFVESKLQLSRRLIIITLISHFASELEKLWPLCLFLKFYWKKPKKIPPKTECLREGVFSVILGVSVVSVLLRIEATEVRVCA